jgi:hypothetical protein
MWVGANLEHAETFRVAHFVRFPGVRLVCSNPLRLYFPPSRTRRDAPHLSSVEKWAGANLEHGKTFLLATLRGL